MEASLTRTTTALLITRCPGLPGGVCQHVIQFHFVICDLSQLWKSHILIPAPPFLELNISGLFELDQMLF